MKKITILLLGLFAIISLQAQNYYIDFTASGAATTLDSVFVENLTQGTSLTLQGSDTLHLYGAASIYSYNHNNTEFRIYPNPFNEKSYLEFYSEALTVATIDVYDAVGKHIVQLRQDIQKGANVFEISGFAAGHYHLTVKTANWQKSASFISTNTRSHSPQIELKSTFTEDIFLKSTTKSTKNIIQMPYTTGDEMRFTGYSGPLGEFLEVVPTSSKTIDFIFTSSSCGNILTDTRDGNQYPTVLIGAQCWMAKNLAYMPSVVGSDTGSQTTPYYYVYGYDGTDTSAAKATANYTTYGVLYNWPAAMSGAASSTANPSGVQGVCPTGWHLPSDAEWTQLTDYLGGTLVAGGKLKETGTTHWNSPNTGATNETGFTARPSGRRRINGAFAYIGIYGYWWSATKDEADGAWLRYVFYHHSAGYRVYTNEANGFSVRCLRD